MFELRTYRFYRMILKNRSQGLVGLYVGSDIVGVAVSEGVNGVRPIGHLDRKKDKKTMEESDRDISIALKNLVS